MILHVYDTRDFEAMLKNIDDYTRCYRITDPMFVNPANDFLCLLSLTWLHIIQMLSAGSHSIPIQIKSCYWKGPLEDVLCVPANRTVAYHDDVIKWNHFPRYWPIVRGIPSQRPVTRTLMFSLICAWTNGWIRLNTQSIRRWFETTSRSLRRHCTVMRSSVWTKLTHQ